MNSTSKMISSLLILIGVSTGWAIGTTEPPIRKGTPIMVESYEATAKAVQVTMVNEPAVGPNYADVEDLIKAIGISGPKAEEFRKQPTTAKGVVYHLQSNLKLLNFFELKARLPADLRKKVEADAKAKVQAEKAVGLKKEKAKSKKKPQ